MKRINAFFAILLTMLLMSGLVFAQDTTRVQPVPQWAQDGLAKWDAAYNAGDAARLAQLYSEDAVVKFPDRPARGRTAIEASFKKGFKSADIQTKGAIDVVRVMNDLAIFWGHDEFTSTPKGGGKSTTGRSNWLSVHEKQPDGSWLIIRDTYNIAEPEAPKKMSGK